MILKTNEAIVKVEGDTPLGLRGVESVTVKPLNWTQEDRVDAILEEKSDAAQKKFLDSLEGNTKIESMIKGIKDIRDINDNGSDDKDSDDKSDAAVLKAAINSYKPAYTYMVYAGVKGINEVNCPKPPKGSLELSEKVEEGWLDECTSKEVRQLASIVIDQTGMIESKVTEGNDTVAFTPRPVPAKE